MSLKGKAFKFGDNISTDHIIPGRLAHLRSNLPELAKHTMEDADPTFASRVRSGDFVVADRNFGCGSSREHAPIVLKMSGVGAVLARSASRLFYRNAINVGLPILLCDTSGIADGDELEVDMERGLVRNLTRNQELSCGRIPQAMLQILAEGGLVAYIKKHGDFKLPGQG